MKSVYKSSRWLAVYQGAVKGAALWLICLAVYGLSAVLLKYTIWGGWLLTGLAAAVIAGSVFHCRKRIVSITVDEQKVVIRYSESIEEQFQVMETDFGTLVENQTFFGFVYYVKRYMQIEGQRYPCYCFSGKTFLELNTKIQDIKKEQQEQDDSEEFNSDSIIVGCITFRVPRKELLQNERKRILKIALESLGVAAILFTAWCISRFRGMEPEISIVLTSAAILVGFLLCLPVVLELIRYQQYKNRLPGEIAFEEDAVKVDELEFNLDEIELITMTPESYTRSGKYSFMRRFSIQGQFGIAEYLLGYTQTKELQYKEYGQLLQTAERICTRGRIRFVLEL